MLRGISDVLILLIFFYLKQYLLYTQDENTTCAAV